MCAVGFTRTVLYTWTWLRSISALKLVPNYHLKTEMQQCCGVLLDQCWRRVGRRLWSLPPSRLQQHFPSTLSYILKSGVDTVSMEYLITLLISAQAISAPRLFPLLPQICPSCKRHFQHAYNYVTEASNVRITQSLQFTDATFTRTNVCFVIINDTKYI